MKSVHPLTQRVTAIRCAHFTPYLLNDPSIVYIPQSIYIYIYIYIYTPVGMLVAYSKELLIQSSLVRQWAVHFEVSQSSLSCLPTDCGLSLCWLWDVRQPTSCRPINLKLIRKVPLFVKRIQGRISDLDNLKNCQKKNNFSFWSTGFCNWPWQQVERWNLFYSYSSSKQNL